MSTTITPTGNGKPTSAAAPPVEKTPLPHEHFKDRIPVRVLQAHPHSPFDLPGRISSSSITTNAKERSNADHHVIEWIPAMRHFVVVFHEKSTGLTHVRYIHEQNVRQWQPAA